MTDFAFSLDLPSALALFTTLTASESERMPEVDVLEEALRGFLYERLSIEEMEDPRKLYGKLHIERERRAGRT